MDHEGRKIQFVNGEISRVCNFLSLKISYRILMILLLLISIIQILTGGIIVTLWLLIAGVIVPMFADQFGRKIRENERSFVLTTLVSKYGYTDLAYRSLSNAFLFEILMLLLWQYANRGQVINDYIISIMPTGLIVTTVLIRLICYFGYRVLIKYKMKYNAL